MKKKKIIYFGAVLVSIAMITCVSSITAISEEKTILNDVTAIINPIKNPSLSPGDILFNFDVSTPTGDIYCVGVEFDGQNYWVTGADFIPKLYKFDGNFNLLNSYDQGTESFWGWRDLAWDGTYLYGSDEYELAKINPATGSVVEYMEKPPGFEEVPCRGLAYDPATDHFYTADWDSDIVEFDRNGDIKHSYSNELSIYGLAWDAVTDGGPWLWAYSQDVTSGNDLVLISQIDPTTGIPTGIQYEGWEDPSYDDAAGGACFTEGSRNESIFVGLTQSSADTVFGMNILGEPPDPPAISGPTSGTVRKPYDYHFTAEDPDGDDIAEYIIEWGDTTSDTVVGPFASGETVTATHTWITAGVYTITARAKDVNGLVGLEGSLEITMPKAKSMQFSLFYRFFQRYPNAFPILRQLLGL